MGVLDVGKAVDGKPVGNLVVGVFVGELEGAAVGFIVGDAVGAYVGDDVGHVNVRPLVTQPSSSSSSALMLAHVGSLPTAPWMMGLPYMGQTTVSEPHSQVANVCAIAASS